jgi:hypothetical protein
VNAVGQNCVVGDELTFARFTDLLLARTYEREKRDGSAVFFAVGELMEDLAPYVDSAWLWQSAQLLESRNLVQAAIPTSGDAQVLLTAEGRLFVEDEQGTGLIGQYRQQDQVVLVIGDGNQVAVGHGQTVRQSGEFSKEEALELVDEAERRLHGADLPAEEREEALADLETVKMQLKKKNPNLAAVKAVLSGLRDVKLIADLADTLYGLLT